MTIDDNTTQIVLAAISVIGIAVTGVISLLSLQHATAAKTSSEANAATLATVAHAVDGLATARVEAEQRVGDAKAVAAHAEGRIEELKAAAVPPPQASP
jgi:hypothetical protein